MCLLAGAGISRLQSCEGFNESDIPEEYAKIQNEFSEGSECEKLYEEVYEAKQRISQKLHKAGEENADVELIINHMFDICRIVSAKMFEYGAITA